MQKFLTQLNKYLEYGVFKKIYSNDNIIVCNVLNQYYASFNTEYIKKTGNDLGIMMNSSGVKLVVEDNNFWFEYVSGMDSDIMGKRLIELSDAYLKKLITAKPKYDLAEPGQNVDLDLEEQIKQRSK